MTNDEPVTSSAPPLPSAAGSPLRPRLHDVLRFAVEGFSLLGAVAFFGTVILNQTLFDRWRLSFLQLASPADVVMAGLGAVLMLWPLVLQAAIGSLVGMATRPVRLLWWALFGLECALAVALGVTVAVQTGGLEGARGLLIVSVLPLAHLLTHPQRGRLIPRRALTLASGLLLAGSLLSILAMEMHWQTHGGHHETRMHLLQPALPACHGLVLWQGERAMVVECGYGERSDVRVLRNVENIIITTGAVPHPGQPTPSGRR